MATNLSIISDALRALNVINETETPSADQGSLCLRELNQMMAEWAVTDQNLGYATQDSTSDTCPIPAWAESGVKYQLALRVAHFFGAEPNVSAVAAAEIGLGVIQRVLHNLRSKGVDMSHLPMGAGVASGFNIDTGWQ
jgi:hypothetical protein